MPNRMLKEGIKRSAQIDQLSWFEEVVFYRLLVTADDFGCVDGRPVLLKNDLFPTKENVTKKAVEDAISHLASVGLLCKYTVSGTPYLFFPTWEKHQRLRAKKRKYPAPPDDIVRQAFDNHMTDTCLSNDGQVTDIGLLELEDELELELEDEKELLSNESLAHAKPERFVAPTIEQVRAFCQTEKLNIDPARFVNYYEGRGWMLGNQPMVNWKAVLKSWGDDKKPAEARGGQRDKFVDPMTKRAIDRMMGKTGAETQPAQLDPLIRQVIEERKERRAGNNLPTEKEEA